MALLGSSLAPGSRQRLRPRILKPVKKQKIKREIRLGTGYLADLFGLA